MNKAWDNKPWDKKRAIAEIDKHQNTFLKDEQKLAEQMILVSGAFFALLSINEILTLAEKVSATLVLFSIICGLLFFIVRLVESIESFNFIEEKYFPDFHKMKKDLGINEVFPNEFKFLERVANFIGGRRSILFIQFISLMLAFMLTSFCFLFSKFTICL